MWYFIKLCLIYIIGHFGWKKKNHSLPCSWWPSWVFNRSKRQQHLVSSLQWSCMTIFNSILRVVSEKNIFEISANQRLLWLLAAILDNRSEQQQLIRTLSATFLPSMVPIHQVLEKKFVLHISHRVAMLNYVPRWRPSWVFN